MGLIMTEDDEKENQEQLEHDAWNLKGHEPFVDTATVEFAKALRDIEIEVESGEWEKIKTSWDFTSTVEDEEEAEENVEEFPCSKCSETSPNVFEGPNGEQYCSIDCLNEEVE